MTVVSVQEAIPHIVITVTSKYNNMSVYVCSEITHLLSTLQFLAGTVLVGVSVQPRSIPVTTARVQEQT